MELIGRLLGKRELRRRIAENRDPLYRVALAWCGDPAVADDLVQETLMISLQYALQLRDPEKLRSWMHVILRNCWKKYLGRLRPSFEIDETAVGSEPDAEAACSELEIVERVRVAILRLPVAQRETLTLVDLSGFTYAEAAGVLGVPIGTVSSTILLLNGFFGNTMQVREVDDICGPVWDYGIAVTRLKPKAVTVFVDYPFIFERVHPMFAGFCSTLLQYTRNRTLYGMGHPIPQLRNLTIGLINNRLFGPRLVPDSSFRSRLSTKHFVKLCRPHEPCRYL